jgi:DNA polymerase
MDVGKLQLIYTLRALWIVLPSGRRLAYWRPRMHTGLRFIGTVDERGALVRRAVETTAPRYFTEAKNRKDMTEQDTYGGKLAENVTQAVARDLLAAALVRLRQTPYEVVLHVHDSIAAEVPEGQGSVAAFCALMARSPAWAKGLPLAVSGYRGRYFKG